MIIKNIRGYIKLYDNENYLFSVISPVARKRGYLTFGEYYKICMWKSNRQKPRYIKNIQTALNITKEAFSENDETKKIKTLCKLEGVGIPTASAILAVVFPDKYGVIDVRCIDMLRKFNFPIRQQITIKNWLKYLEVLRKLASENKVTPREVDMALFAMHREKLEKDNFRNLYKKYAPK